jgi:hypothetical protein
MAVEILLLAKVHQMRIHEPLGRGMVIGDGLFLSNDQAIPRRIMNETTIRTIGDMEASYLLEAPLFIHGRWEEQKALGEIAAIPYLNIKMRQIFAFYDCLWTLRDNCVNSETVFLIEREDGVRGERISVNGMAYRYDRADAEIVEEEFGRAEIQAARDKFAFRFRALEEDRITPEMEFEGARKSGRIGRAFKFHFAARVASSTFLKIANLCSCLEALFCSDSSEIAHKLAERSAVFLEAEPEKRMRIYRFVKKAYGIRSHVIHGSAVKGEVEELVGTCVGLAQLVREIFNRILSNEDEWDFFMKSEKDAFEQHFLEKILR